MPSGSGGQKGGLFGRNSGGAGRGPEEDCRTSLFRRIQLSFQSLVIYWTAKTPWENSTPRAIWSHGYQCGPLEASLALRPRPSKYSVLAKPEFCEKWSSALDELTFVCYKEFMPIKRDVAILSKTTYTNGSSSIPQPWLVKQGIGISLRDQ